MWVTSAIKVLKHHIAETVEVSRHLSTQSSFVSFHHFYFTHFFSSNLHGAFAETKKIEVNFLKLYDKAINLCNKYVSTYRKVNTQDAV